MIFRAVGHETNALELRRISSSNLAVTFNREGFEQLVVFHV